MRLFAAALLALIATPAALAMQPAPSATALYREHDPESRITIDYNIFHHILDSVIYDVGQSDRRIARGRMVSSGTRINRQSTSTYRYEGNRIWYHLLDDQHLATIHEYRQELEQLPTRVDIADLSSNEQLAYWLNLYNVVMIDELARAYPVRYVNTVHVDGERLLQAPIVDLPAGTLSLDQIRNDIVLANWPDPRVLYGFYTGAIGGPSIQEHAFTGDRVWRQLNGIGVEFVNALRGVDGQGRTIEVSAIYHDNQTLFPEWPEDLRAHLLLYANGEAEGAVRNAENFRQLNFDTSIADLTHGSNCGGGGANPVLTVNYQTGQESFSGACEPIPAQAAELIIEVRERRIRLFEAGRLGQVTLRDIPTEDTSEPTTIRQAPGQPVLIQRGQRRQQGDEDESE
jgi:hypothetical protein